MASLYWLIYASCAQKATRAVMDGAFRGVSNGHMARSSGRQIERPWQAEMQLVMQVKSLVRIS